ncbi:hypothetical protein MNBD_GAMMA11-1143 [hydrothermal vent metagenome]|uniref:Uncharacterized protein n=1 Tax=hydrothermal vent metagenome TaxID=652676 RepID=A0A3B0X5B9_9ZZZZ
MRRNTAVSMIQIARIGLKSGRGVGGGKAVRGHSSYKRGGGALPLLSGRTSIIDYVLCVTFSHQAHGYKVGHAFKNRL